MKQYYATFDGQGNVTGHYVDDINDNIPKSAVKLTEDEWKQSCEGNLIRDIKNKKWTHKPKPSTLEILNKEKEIKKFMINSIRDEKISEGVSYSGYTFDSDDKSVNNINQTLTSISVGISLPKDFTWRTKDNKNVPANKEFLIGLLQEIINHKTTYLKKSWELKDKIDKAKSVDEVSKINW